MDERLNLFSKNVISLMKQRKLTAPALAKHAGLSTKTLNNILHGRHEAQTDTLQAIADGLAVPLWQLWLPYMPTDMADDDTFPRLVTIAAKLSPEAAKRVARIAELELSAKDPI